MKTLDERERYEAEQTGASDYAVIHISRQRRRTIATATSARDAEEIRNALQLAAEPRHLAAVDWADLSRLLSRARATSARAHGRGQHVDVRT